MIDLNSIEINDQATAAFNLEQHRKAEALREDYQRNPNDPLDSLSLDQIEALCRRSIAAEEQKTVAARQEEAAKQFVAERPDFVCTPVNQQRVDMYFKSRGLDATNVDHFHEAANALASRKLLKLDESKVKRQPRKQYSEADLQNMPLAELEALARGQ
jgi:hypothetical protein